MANTDVLDGHEDDDESEQDEGFCMPNAGEQLKALRSRIESLQATMEQKVELINLVANLTHHRYSALTKAGFSQSEALALLNTGWTEDME